MPTIRLAITVNGTEQAGLNIPARKVKAWIGRLVRQGLLKADATVAEQAAALLTEFRNRCLLGAKTEFGAEPFDEMLAAVAEANPEAGWDQTKVQAEGVRALEVAYDALP